MSEQAATRERAGAEILVVRCGIVPYERAGAMQRDLEARRQAEEVPDVLLLLEHPPVYTRGRRSRPEELPMGVEWYEAQGIEVIDTDRGGLVTYHGPGQLVAYPIVGLAPYGDDVHEFVRGLERVTIEALGSHGVEATVIEGLTGIWVPRPPEPGGRGTGGRDMASALDAAAGRARKIGSIGLHVSRGVTTHGLAVNVNNDLQPFEWIVPCGIEGCAVTSLGRELGAEQDLGAFAGSLAERFGGVFGRRLVPTDPAELGLAQGDASPDPRTAADAASPEPAADTLRASR